MADLIYLDIETQKGNEEVGGWYPEKMGLAVAVTFDNDNSYRIWYENQVKDLISQLLTFKRVVGFNLNRFDYGVLMAYDSTAKSRLVPKTLDLLDDIYKKLKFRIKLDDLVKSSLNKGKSGDGLQSLKWWKEGKTQLVADYCKEDVALTKELHEFGRLKGHVYYPSFGKRKLVSVSW